MIKIKIGMTCVYKEYENKNGTGAMTIAKNKVIIGLYHGKCYLVTFFFHILNNNKHFLKKSSLIGFVTLVSWLCKKKNTIP